MSKQAHRFERMSPSELRQTIATSPIAYVPIGTYEWHSEHLPVGLDSLTAHGLCLAAAARAGGVVFPALYYGTGGGHGAYPFTAMLPEPGHIEAILGFTLSKLKSFGFRRVVLFSGHFPPEQLDMIDRLAAKHGDVGMSVFATAVNRIPGLAIAPDHAGVFETTLLYALHPDLVHIERLPSVKDEPLTKDDWDESRHDPKHPVYGVFGPDPRKFDPKQAQPLLEAAVTWLAEQVKIA